MKHFLWNSEEILLTVSLSWLYSLKPLYKLQMVEIQNFPYKKGAIHPSWKLSKLDEPDMWDTAEEVGTSL